MARQLIDDLRARQKPLKHLRDVSSQGVVWQPHDDNARVTSKWIPTDVSEIEISSNDRSLVSRAR